MTSRRWFLSTALILVAVVAYAQGRYGNARGLVNRIQENLRRAERFTPPSGDDVKNVVENNTLSAEDRDKLTRDLGELRELRRTRDAQPPNSALARSTRALM